jgi:signal transduction histidine kinase
MPEIRPPARRKLYSAALGAVLLVAGVCWDVWPQSRVATTAAEVSRRKRSVSGSPPAARIDGVVTYFDPANGLLFVQDATGGVRVSVGGDGPRYSPGERVTVAGVVSEAEVSPVILNPRIVAHGAGPLPVAQPITAAAFGTRQVENRLVAVEGVVQRADTKQNGLALVVRISQGGTPVDVYCQEYSGSVGDELDRRVRVTGVATSDLDVELKTVGRTLWSVSWAATVHLDPVRSPGSAPLATTASLRGMPTDRLPERRVRVRGRLEAAGQAGLFRIRDATGSLKVQFGFTSSVRLGEDVAVAGFPRRDSSGSYLDSASMLADNIPLGREASTPVLTSIHQVRSLPPNEAMRRYPVHVRATVTYYDPGGYIVFVEDRNDGIYVSPHELPVTGVGVGDLVDIDALSAAGNFAPILSRAHVRVVARNVPLPRRRTFMDRILSGAEDSRLVDLEGVIRNASASRNVASLDVLCARNRFSAYVPGLAAPERLLDARVAIHGVCGTLYNDRRQIRGIQLFVPGPRSLRVIEPPSASARVAVDHVLDFAAGRLPGHRVRVGGIVTWSSASLLFIRDADNGLRVDLRGNAQLAPGDRVDVLGYPRDGPVVPLLEDSEAYPNGHGRAPDPVVTSAQELVRGLHANQLVQLDAYVRGSTSSVAEELFELRSGTTTFHAVFDKAAGQRLQLDTGSKVRLTGIFDVQSWRPVTRAGTSDFHILLRSPSDAAVLVTAPWWTGERALQAIAVVAGAALIAFGWVFVLRRKVRQQTATIRQKLETEVTLRETAEAARRTQSELTELKRVEGQLVAARDAAEEANRAKSRFLANMSHELRTPLNAIIGYSQMLREDAIGPGQPEILSDLEKIERSGHILLGIINDVLDLSKIEAGRFEIDLRNVDVADVLTDVCNAVEPLARHQGNVVSLHCPEDARLAFADLPKFRQSLLNLVHNACKFTLNGQVSAAVSRLRGAERDWIEVRVSDTGIGIRPEDLGKLFQPFSQVDNSATRKYGGTGLGLAISKKFCQMMGGDIAVESEPGKGSCFSLRVPAADGRHPQPGKR